MAEKLYKRKFTNEDIMLVQNYIAKNSSRLLVEIWQDDSDDGDVFDIKPQSLAHAITLTDKYYDSINANKKVAELLCQEKNGEYTCVYHTERNRSGLTFEILNYARKFAGK